MVTSMWRRSFAVTSKAALAAALVVAGAACTQKAADATKEKVDSALDATKAGANKAIDATKAAGDKTKDAAQNAAGAAQDAAVRTRQVVTDPIITGKLKAKFADEKVLQGSRIDVDTSQGVVTLKGTVLSVTAKSRAEVIAQGTEGVASVVNLLVVQ